MRVYLTPQPGLSRAMDRVTKALVANVPPGVKIVPTVEEADLHVIHVIGYPETVETVKTACDRRQRYAVIQYCLTSTQEPKAATWVPVWYCATAVWSYYDLIAAFPDEDMRASAGYSIKFYHAPLGIDTEIFRRPPIADERYFLGCSGYVAESECLEECANAVQSLGGRLAHLGHDLPLVGQVDRFFNLHDWQLVRLWASCRYVAGLRRIEGFELPVYEGLACGARPLVFDRPHYRAWLGDHASYVPEVEPALLTPLIANILSEPRPVTADERQWVKERFDWNTIAKGFWERCL